MSRSTSRFSSWCNTRLALNNIWTSHYKNSHRITVSQWLFWTSPLLSPNKHQTMHLQKSLLLWSVSCHLPPEKKTKIKWPYQHKNSSSNSWAHKGFSIHSAGISKLSKFFHILNLNYVKLQTHLDKTWTFSKPLPEAALKKDSSFFIL